MTVPAFSCLPRREDFFPNTKRGHGSTHPFPRLNAEGTKTREGNPCADGTCSLHMPKSKNLHTDKKANLTDWCDERGLRMKRMTAAEAMVLATGGR